MPKYIDADRLLDSIKKSANECRNWKAEAIDDEIKARADAGLAAFIECALRVEHQPTADVEEVKHGEWIVEDAGGGWKRAICPRCDKIFLYAKGQLQIHAMPRCPNCGAKMDGKKGDNDGKSEC